MHCVTGKVTANLEVPITQALFARISVVLILGLADLSWASPIGGGGNCKDVLSNLPHEPTVISETIRETKIAFKDFAQANELAKDVPVGAQFSFADVNKIVSCQVTGVREDGSPEFNCDFHFGGTHVNLSDREMNGLEIALQMYEGAQVFVQVRDQNLDCRVFPKNAEEGGFHCRVSSI